jgi:hypothetical protein
MTRQRSVSIPNNPVVGRQPNDDFADGPWKDSDQDGKRRSTFDGGSFPDKEKSANGVVLPGGYDDQTGEPPSADNKPVRSGSLGQRSTSTSAPRGMSANVHDGGSTFINGPGTTGPHVKPEVDEDEIAERTGYAEEALTEKEKRNIEKGEGGLFPNLIVPVFTETTGK